MVQHLNKYEVSVQLILTPWVMGLFTQTIPLNSIVSSPLLQNKFFDRFFVEGWLFFYKVVL
jgi:hypothetical protein